MNRKQLTPEEKMRLEARRRATAKQPKCPCGNCLPFGVASGYCSSCQREAEKPTLESLTLRIEALEAQNEITVQQAIKLSIAQKRVTELEAALREVDDHATGMERFNITVGNTIGFIRDTVRKSLTKDQQ